MEMKEFCEPIKDRYKNTLKEPEEKPTLAQSIQSWALLNELLELGYPHNFQHEAPHISNYLFDLSALIDKALKIKRSCEEDESQ
jgi:hypothetical protein